MAKQYNKQKSLTPQEYIRSKARKLPIGKCYMTTDWEKCGEGIALVTRIHPQGTFTIGIYLIDTFCLGVKESRWKFSIDNYELEEVIRDFERCNFSKVSYKEVHNLIYGSVAFAEEVGIQPNKSFELTRYILEEDTEDIPLIEYNYGKGGKHFLCAKDKIELSEYIPKLKKALGDDFLFSLPMMEEPKRGDEYIDNKTTDAILSTMNYLKNQPKIQEEKYSFINPEFPSKLEVKHKWLADMLYSPDNSIYMNDNDLEKILSVTHDELRKDLENIILYETGQTCNSISEEKWNNEYYSVLLHCILLLGEIGDKNSLNIILLTLCQNSDFFDFHFGDITNEVYIPTLYKLGKQHLDDFMHYMQIPGLYSFARINISGAIALLGNREPERRKDVIEWFRTLLNFYDGKLDTCQSCDGLLIGMMTEHLLDLHATELLPELKILYDTGLVDEECCGDFDEISREMKRHKSSLHSNYKLNINERYKELKRWIN